MKLRIQFLNKKRKAYCSHLQCKLLLGSTHTPNPDKLRTWSAKCNLRREKFRRIITCSRFQVNREWGRDQRYAAQPWDTYTYNSTFPLPSSTSHKFCWLCSGWATAKVPLPGEVAFQFESRRAMSGVRPREGESGHQAIGCATPCSSMPRI